jgi:hypothetical protein
MAHLHCADGQRALERPDHVSTWAEALLRMRHSISTTLEAFVLLCFAYTSDVRRLFCLREVILHLSLASSRHPLPRCVLGDFAVSTGAHIGARRRLGAASVATERRLCKLLGVTAIGRTIHCQPNHHWPRGAHLRAVLHAVAAITADPEPTNRDEDRKRYAIFDVVTGYEYLRLMLRWLHHVTLTAQAPIATPSMRR